MKKPMKKISLLLFGIMILISCSKNDEGTSVTNQLTAKIDGVTWSADVDNSNSYATLNHNTLLTINGSEADPTKGSFLVFIRDYTGKGTYKVGKESSNGSYARFTTGSVAANYQSWSAEISDNTIGTGTIEVTSDTGSFVTGTFSLNLYNKNTKTTKIITEGSFKLNLKTQ